MEDATEFTNESRSPFPKSILSNQVSDFVACKSNCPLPANLAANWGNGCQANIPIKLNVNGDTRLTIPGYCISMAYYNTDGVASHPEGDWLVSCIIRSSRGISFQMWGWGGWLRQYAPSLSTNV